MLLSPALVLPSLLLLALALTSPVLPPVLPVLATPVLSPLVGVIPVSVVPTLSLAALVVCGSPLVGVLAWLVAAAPVVALASEAWLVEPAWSP